MKVLIEAKLKLNYLYHLTSVKYEIKYKLPNKFFKEETSLYLAHGWTDEEDVERKIINMHNKGELKPEVIKDRIIEAVKSHIESNRKKKSEDDEFEFIINGLSGRLKFEEEID